MSKQNAWTSEEIKQLKKAIKKEGVSAGCRTFSENSDRSVASSSVKYYSLMKPKSMKKRKYNRKRKAKTQKERMNVAEGLTFDIQNIKRATLNGDNSLTLFF